MVFSEYGVSGEGIGIGIDRRSAGSVPGVILIVRDRVIAFVEIFTESACGGSPGV